MLTNLTYKRHLHRSCQVAKRALSKPLTSQNNDFFRCLLKAFLIPKNRYVVREGKSYTDGRSKGHSERTLRSHACDAKRIAIIFDEGLFSIPLEGLSYHLTKTDLYLFVEEMEWHLAMPDHDSSPITNNQF